MKTSSVLLLTDILPHRRKLIGKVIKSKVFKKHSESQVFARLKKAGVEGIELHLPDYGKTPLIAVEEARQVLVKNDMPVFSVHQSLHILSKTKLPEITKLFRIADMVGAKIIVLHITSAGKQIFDKEYIATLKSLEKQYGVQIGFENHEKNPFSRFYKHAWDEEKFPASIAKAGFNMTLDTTHLAQAGGNIIAFFKKHKDRIINIHLSDFRPHKFSGVRLFRYKHMPLGKGALPITEFLKTLMQENYDGIITMEIHADLKGICESARIITSLTEEKEQVALG